jgi:DNA replication protein DnaC
LSLISFLHDVPGFAAFAASLTPEAPADRTAHKQQKLKHEREAAAREKLATREAILRDRGVPAKHRALILADKLDETPTMARTRSWLADDRRVLTLVGVPDAGKTTAASWAAAQEPSAADLRLWTPRTGLPAVVFLAAEDLAGAWQARKERDPITRRTLADLRDCWLLVIDDLGQEPGIIADMVGEAVDILVRRRSDDGYRTLITSNLATPAALEQRYTARGQRMHESMLEHGYFSPFKALGYRRRKAAT